MSVKIRLRQLSAGVAVDPKIFHLCTRVAKLNWVTVIQVVWYQNLRLPKALPGLD